MTDREAETMQALSCWRGYLAGEVVTDALGYASGTFVDCQAIIRHAPLALA